MTTKRRGLGLGLAIPRTQLVSVLVVIPALVILAIRHRSGHQPDEPASFPRHARLGCAGP